MSNVRTLKDLERQETTSIKSPTSAPFPDPWKKYPQRYSSSDDADVSRQYQFSYIGVDGQKYTETAKQPPGFGYLCCIGCCPCLISPICSSEKQQQWKNLFKTFCFWISVVQLILLIVSLGVGGFAPPSQNPMLGPPGATLLLLGAKFLPDIMRGHVWRLIVPIFLHAGIIHIIFNVFAQLRFGILVEKKWGLLKFLLIYFGSGVGGCLMSCLTSPLAISVGASGAIMGLMGGFLSDIIMTWHKSDPVQRKMNLFQTVFVIVITMIFSATPFVDAGAHFGGVVVGFLLGNILFAAEHQNAKMRRIAPIVSVSLLISFVVIAILVIALYYARTISY